MTSILVESIAFDGDVGTPTIIDDVVGGLSVLTINLTGFSIPSAEDFRRIMLANSILSNVSIGNVLIKLELQAPSLPFSSLTVGQPKLNHIVASSIATSEKVGYGKIFAKTTRPGVNSVVASQFPSFVQEDHPRFLTFMKAYYEWLEQAGNALHASKRVLEYQDIDDTVDQFADHLFKEFLPNIPRAALVNKSTLLKFIKQFYRAKGTEKSYKFFFRMLYNTNVEFYYPRTDILRVSDGKWVQHKTVRVVPIKGNITSLFSQKIRGKTKNCTAFVERVVGVESGPFYGYELFLNRSSITGTFLPNEIIESEDGSTQARVTPIPTSVLITNPGTNYKVGDIFDIVGGGVGAKLKVDRVGPLGEVEKTSIVAFGLEYNTNLPPTVNFAHNSSQTPSSGLNSGPTNPIPSVVAAGVVALGGITEYPGYYLNEDGQLSTSKYLHDGEFYQQFSYVTYVQASLNEYKELLKKLVHPVGLKHFGGIRIQDLLKVKLKNPQTNFPTKRTIHLKSIGSSMSLFTQCIVGHDMQKDPRSFSLGPTNYSIYQNRFSHKPFEKYDANQEMFGVNFGYWGNYNDLGNQKAVSPIKHFGHMKPSEIEKTHPWQSINMVADSYIRMVPVVTAVSIEVSDFFGNCAISGV